MVFLPQNYPAHTLSSWPQSFVIATQVTGRQADRQEERALPQSRLFGSFRVIKSLGPWSGATPGGLDIVPIVFLRSEHGNTTKGRGREHTAHLQTRITF